MNNPFLNLPYEPAFQALGSEFSDEVAAAQFPAHHLRFRNDDLLSKLGLDPSQITDQHWLDAFGRFKGLMPLLAMRYHGYQFGEYNPRLGDGRGFLYGQVRGIDGELYDLGTKGSGTTPYSRTADGRLTLKGGVREVLAAEALHAQGVRTSRCLSLVETGEELWRGDEPSPTRSSVMVRFSRSHIRFGTFERLYYLERPDLIEQLLYHVIQYYYPHLVALGDRYLRFWDQLIERVAQLCAQWMSVGFCHGVLNTDNMSITGESFDYGPYAWITQYDPTFTAAYFDHYGRYCFGNQPGICQWNLAMLQRPLSMVLPMADLENGLARFADYYYQAYHGRIFEKLGLPPHLASPTLCNLTLQTLEESQVNYHDFFLDLRDNFNSQWFEEETAIPLSTDLFQPWRAAYFQALTHLAPTERLEVPQRLDRHNPRIILNRPRIEAVWEPISQGDDWGPFYTLLDRIRVG